MLVKHKVHEPELEAKYHSGAVEGRGSCFLLFAYIFLMGKNVGGVPRVPLRRPPKMARAERWLSSAAIQEGITGSLSRPTPAELGPVHGHQHAALYEKK